MNENQDWSEPSTQWSPPSKKVEASVLSSILLGGDLAKLTPDQKIQYYAKVCETVGLNPLTRPFDYITLNGRQVLYANKGCAEQLRAIHKIGLRVTSSKKDGDIYIVVVEAVDPLGRTDSGLGAVSVVNLKGEALANAMMKAETKAKRRATLSICGMNMLDETEVDTIPRVVPQQPEAGDGIQEDLGYRIPFGQWAKRSIEEVYDEFGAERISQYITYLEVTAEKKNKPIAPAGPIAEFIARAEQYCGMRENCPTENGENVYDEPGSSG